MVVIFGWHLGARAGFYTAYAKLWLGGEILRLQKERVTALQARTEAFVFDAPKQEICWRRMTCDEGSLLGWKER